MFKLVPEALLRPRPGARVGVAAQREAHALSLRQRLEQARDLQRVELLPGRGPGRPVVLQGGIAQVTGKAQPR